jgi:hypothetical protein
MAAEERATLEIEKPTLLSFSYTPERFGGEFTFGTRLVLRLEFAGIDVTGINKQVGTQVSNLYGLANTGDYCKVKLGENLITDSLGVVALAKITSFNLQEGDWTQFTAGNITLEIFDKLNSVGPGGVDYPEFGVSFADFDARFLEDFTEEFSFEQGPNSINYNHSINLKFSEAVAHAANNPPGRDALRSEAVIAASKIAKSFVQDPAKRPAFAWLNDVNFQDLYSDINNTYKRYFTETHDQLNNSVSIVETFDAQNLKGDAGSKYSFFATQNFSVDEKGVITVAEKGEIIGLVLGGEGVTAAQDVIPNLPETELQTELTNATTPTTGRLDKMFIDYRNKYPQEKRDAIPDLNKDNDGNILLIEQGITRNLFEAKISYDIKATNDATQSGGNCKHEFTKTLRVAEQQVWYDDTDPAFRPYFTITQQGTFTGNDIEVAKPDEEGAVKGKKMPIYDKAVECWVNQKEGIKTSLRNDIGVESPQKYHVEISNTYSPIKGQVGYNISYSSAPAYAPIDKPYKKLSFNRQIIDPTQSTEDLDSGSPDPSLYQYNVENVINHPQETQLVQKRKTVQEPSSALKLDVVGKRSVTLGELCSPFGFMGENDERGNPIIDPENSKCSYIESCSMTWNDENDKKLTLNITWK